VGKHASRPFRTYIRPGLTAAPRAVDGSAPRASELDATGRARGEGTQRSHLRPPALEGRVTIVTAARHRESGAHESGREEKTQNTLQCVVAKGTEARSPTMITWKTTLSWSPVVDKLPVKILETLFCLRTGSVARVVG